MKDKILLRISLGRSHHPTDNNISYSWRRTLHDYEQENHPAIFLAKVWDAMHCQGKSLRQVVRGISRILDWFQKRWGNTTFWAKNVRKMILPETLIWSELGEINHLKIKPRKRCQKYCHKVGRYPSQTNRWNLAQNGSLHTSWLRRNFNLEELMKMLNIILN